MLKFGAITIDTSHPKSFAKKLSEGDRAHYVAVFNDGFREEDEVNSFANHYGMKVCSSVAELADLVDLGLVHSCNWDKHLSYVAPFIERDKPVFIDKPLVGNLKDARKLMELVNSGAKILAAALCAIAMRCRMSTPHCRKTTQKSCMSMFPWATMNLTMPSMPMKWSAHC